MSVNVKGTIRDCCNQAKSKGIKITRGPWADTSQGIVSLCAIGAVLWAHDKLGSENRVREACLLLDVDAMWMRRFWMGFDRGFQAMLVDKDGKETNRDDVGQMGIDLAAELCD